MGERMDDIAWLALGSMCTVSKLIDTLCVIVNAESSSAPLVPHPNKTFPCHADFLAVLARTELSLHSMEVVNRLTNVVALPSEFMHMYIANCMRSCESQQVR